jgi:hypothetical protein
MTQSQEFNIDTILDGTLDDLADMPEFKPFPAGSHRATIRFEQKVINKFSGMEIKLKGIETLELPAGSTEAPLTPGQETSVFYFFQHTNPLTAELGQGKFKEIMKSLADHYGPQTNRALIEAANGSEVLVVTGQRKGKEAGQVYTDIVAVKVV